jgi:pilus assembly protein Flp/PilA
MPGYVLQSRVIGAFRGKPGPRSAKYNGRCARSRHAESRAAFSRDDSGATAIEYGLIAAGIAVAIIAVVNTIGTNLNATFDAVKSGITTTP